MGRDEEAINYANMNRYADLIQLVLPELHMSEMHRHSPSWCYFVVGRSCCRFCEASGMPCPILAVLPVDSSDVPMSACSCLGSIDFLRYNWC